MNSYHFVGNSFPINDAKEKALGTMVYASDMDLYNELHLKLIRSNVPHANIKSIDASEAEKVEGFCAFFCFKNGCHKKYNSYKTFPNQPCCPEDRYIFADKARYVGDVVAVVAADTLDAAERAARLVKIEYEELPVMPSPAESIKKGAAPIHEGGNVVVDYKKVLEGKDFPTNSEDSGSYTTVIRTQKMNHIAIETHSYLANWSDRDGVTVWSPTQGIHGLRIVVADMLGLKFSRVRVIKVPMGGSFGGKQEFIYEPLVAFVAMTMHRPAKLHLSRGESMISTMNRTDCYSEITTTFDSELRIRSCSVESIVDVGAYCGSGMDFTYALSGKIPRLYRCPVYTHHGVGCYSNSPVAGGMRGWGSPEMLTAMEIHMTEVARKLGMDPMDLRLKSLVEPGDVDINNHISLGNAQIKKCLMTGAEAFHWKEKYSAPHGSGRFRRGVGLSCAAHKNGLFGGSPDLSTMTLAMNEDGSLMLRASVHDVGCGTVRTMQIITGEVLHVHPDLVTVSEGDTKYSPYDCGTFGSRTVYAAGACAKDTAEKFSAMLIASASKLLKIQVSDLKLGDGAVVCKDDSSKSITYQEIAERMINEFSTELIITNRYRSSSNPGAYAVNFAEVMVDTLTGVVDIIEILSVNDVGQAINRQMVYNQIRGGLQMAIGYALSEDLAVNAKGYPAGNSLRRYHTRNAVDMPRVKVILLEEGGDKGPFEAKSVGEISTVAGAAAVVNAVNNALETSITEMPLSQERIVKTLTERSQ